MPAFSKKAITDKQLDSLIAYVQYAKNPDDRGGWAIGRIGPVPEGIVAWFIAGLAAGYIYYYPPILLVVGIAAIAKGLMGE